MKRLLSAVACLALGIVLVIPSVAYADETSIYAPFGSFEELYNEYMDAMENYKKYDGKIVKFLALVYNPDKLRKGVMVPGRFAMTCCIEDVTFIGFKCKYEDESSIPHKSWITITARVHVEFAREYKGKGPVLYPVSIEPAEKPQDELVYFS